MEAVAFWVRSISGSRMNEMLSNLVAPSLMYGAGSFPGSKGGSGLDDIQHKR
jgi:hypothetical protein